MNLKRVQSATVLFINKRCRTDDVANFNYKYTIHYTNVIDCEIVRSYIVIFYNTEQGPHFSRKIIVFLKIVDDVKDVMKILWIWN